MDKVTFLMLALVPLLAAAQDYQTQDCPPGIVYQEGVDAKGWAVAPADSEPQAMQTPDSVTLNLNLPASEYSSHPVLNERSPFAEIDAGQVTIPLKPNAAENPCP